MATGRLKTKFVSPAPGISYFSVAELAFCRIIKVMREGVTHYLYTGITPIKKRFKFVSSEGKFLFDSAIPFNDNEKVFIIYKDPLP
jgi:hypothetical protein